MDQVGSIMQGKQGLVMGLANERSLAWGIASMLHQSGAKLALTYQGSSMAKRVQPLADRLGTSLVFDCDVSNSQSLDELFTVIRDSWNGQLDFIVHAIAFSDREELKGRYVETSRENFLKTLDISCYSFTDICRRALPLMKKEGGSMLTLTYFGAERVMPHYNVMGVAKAALETSVRYLAADLGAYGIRVNAISSGPIRTLAASGIGDFRAILRWNELNAPLQRNVTIEDVGHAALYLLSDLGTAVSGEIHHVDCGYNIIGMASVDAASGIAELMTSLSGKPSLGGKL